MHEKIPIKADACMKYLIIGSLILLMMGCSNDSNLSKDIIRAAKRDDVKRVTSIVRANPRLLHYRMSDGITLLHMSAYGWSDEVTAALIKAGADVNVQKSDGGTPLDAAVIFNRTTTVKLLLDSGASPNLTTGENTPPLWSAVMNRNFDIIKMLVKQGADVNSSYKGLSLLNKTMLDSRDRKITSYLKAHGAKLRADEIPIKYKY